MSDTWFDPLSPKFAQDPYSSYTRLREMSSPWYFEPMDSYLLSSYEDVEGAARSSSMVRSPEGVMSAEQVEAEQVKANFHDMPNHERFVQFSLLEQDGEVHRRLRMIVLREFSRTFVEKHRAMIQLYVDRLLDELLEVRRIDFVQDLASRVPGHVIGNVLGVPDDQCPQLRHWSEEIVQYFDADRTPANKARAELATTEFYEFLMRLIDERATTPGDDLLTTLIGSWRAGEMSETELVSTSLLILAGGHGSTIDVLGNGLYALLKNPAQFARLRGEPALVGTAVQEMFRYDSPLPFFHRYAAEDVVIKGKHFPRGTKFGLLYGSANRDPRQFAEADQFIVDRTPNRHVAFGRGAHLCLGNNLARLDMEIIFTTLLARTSSIELLEPAPLFRPGLASRGLISLPVELIPA